MANHVSNLQLRAIISRRRIVPDLADTEILEIEE